MPVTPKVSLRLSMSVCQSLSLSFVPYLPAYLSYLISDPFVLQPLYQAPNRAYICP
jgi:hypothetical protein